MHGANKRQISRLKASKGGEVIAACLASSVRRNGIENVAAEALSGLHPAGFLGPRLRLR
jgi:hypothetical protein